MVETSIITKLPDELAMDQLVVQSDLEKITDSKPVADVSPVDQVQESVGSN